MLLVLTQLLGLWRTGLPLRGSHAEAPARRLSRFSPPRCSASDDERLLLTEPALNAFIVAEMRHFCTNAMNELDYSGSLADRRRRENEMPGEQAVEALCDMTRSSFRRLFNTGLGSKSMDGTDHTGLSNLGSAISFFRDTFEGSRALELPLERVGLSGYQVAHHITDMYHHRTFRGTYTKTLQPSGLGEIAAREAVGLSVAADERTRGGGRGGHLPALESDRIWRLPPVGVGAGRVHRALEALREGADGGHARPSPRRQRHDAVAREACGVSHHGHGMYTVKNITRD